MSIPYPKRKFLWDEENKDDKDKVCKITVKGMGLLTVLAEKYWQRRQWAISKKNEIEYHSSTISSFRCTGKKCTDFSVIVGTVDACIPIRQLLSITYLPLQPTSIQLVMAQRLSHMNNMEQQQHSIVLLENILQLFIIILNDINNLVVCM